MDMSTLPLWAQNAGLVSIALVSAIVGVFKYLKTEGNLENNSSNIFSEINNTTKSIKSSTKVVEELIEVVKELQDEQSRDAKKNHRLFQDLKQSISDLNETIIVQTENLVSVNRSFIKARQLNKLSYRGNENEIN